MSPAVRGLPIVVTIAVGWAARLAWAAAPTAPEPPYLLKSTASAEVSARVDAHLKTQFARYRSLLPPRVKRAAVPTIELFGRLGEYREALSRRNLSIANPACYVAAGHVVLLGFDGARFDLELQSLADRAERLRKDDRELNADLNDRLKAEEQRLIKLGSKPAEVRELTSRRKKQAREASADLKRELDKAEKSLEAGLAEATARLLESASHEAFHAYVAAYVYPPSAGGLPIWLDEGLAQAVEHGTWPKNRLYTAQPPAELRKRLAAARAARNDDDRALFDLIAVLDSDRSRFVLPGSTGVSEEAARQSADAYLAAWSLTQFLLATGRLAPGEKLDGYVADVDSAPMVRFERWQHRPPAEIERDWRNFYQSAAAAR
jgi:hypothetical protein